MNYRIINAIKGQYSKSCEDLGKKWQICATYKKSTPQKSQLMSFFKLGEIMLLTTYVIMTLMTYTSSDSLLCSDDCVNDYEGVEIEFIRTLNPLFRKKTDERR